MVPPPTNLSDEWHQSRTREPTAILRVELVSVAQLRSQTWLRRTSLAEARIITKRSDDANIVCAWATSIRCVLDDVEARVWTHGGVTLLDGDMTTRRCEHARKLTNQRVMTLGGADACRSTTAVRMCATPSCPSANTTRLRHVGAIRV